MPFPNLWGFARLLQLDLSEYAEGARLAEWVPYVQAAREEKEQNMEAYVSGGLLYYRCVRDVRAGSELAVWYSEDFAQILGVQELQSIHFTGTEVLNWGQWTVTEVLDGRLDCIDKKTVLIVITKKHNSRLLLNLMSNWKPNVSLKY